jgi:hypothetical protein
MLRTVYGEMFVSAILSAAFVTNNIEEIISSGSSVIQKMQACRSHKRCSDLAERTFKIAGKTLRRMLS